MAPVGRAAMEIVGRCYFASRCCDIEGVSCMSVFQCFSMFFNGIQWEKDGKTTTQDACGPAHRRLAVTRHGFSEDTGCQNCLRVSKRGVEISLSE